MKKWVVLLIGAALLGGAGHADATTVVAVIDTQAVIIGADSRTMSDAGEWPGLGQQVLLVSQRPTIRNTGSVSV